MAIRNKPSLKVEIGQRGSDPGVSGPCKVTKRKIRKLSDKEKIFDLYYWDQVLQEDGDGGKVVICKKKNDECQDLEYVLKIRSKKTIAEYQPVTEFHQTLLRVLNLPPHLGVTPIIEILENDEYYYCVMERASGGSLVDYLLSTHQDGVMPEAELKQLMHDMLEALGHIHKQGVLHRDIKPQNFVVRQIPSAENLEQPKSPTPPHSPEVQDPVPSAKVVNRVSLIDFDHADADYSPCSPSPKTDYVWGTQGFNAPEQYNGESSPASDLWSIGVILYLFMTGHMPYDTAKMEKEARKEHRNFSSTPNYRDPKKGWFDAVYDKMLTASITLNWDDDVWQKSKACQDFCQQLLAFDPRNRPQSAEEALCHSWFANDE